MSISGVRNFLNGVKIEGKKVAWPVRKEVLASSGIVLVLVTLAAIFFVTVDWLIFYLIRIILGI